MSYGEIGVLPVQSYAAEKNAILVDLRSDTLTKPTANMRKAMFNAEVGDDVYEEDPTVKELERKAATLLGKEAAIFVASGTMGNLIAVMNHCDERGSEAYCGDESHVILHEQGGAAQLGGVLMRPLPNNKDGTFDLTNLEKKFRTPSVHHTISKLVIVENTINGKIVPQSWIKELASLARKYNLKLHLDGARIWNAHVASEVPIKEMVSDFDSVSFCLSKGLGAPVGSLLCGSKSFVLRARRIRKVLGGGMRQVGVLAAAGLVALEESVPLLKEDHRKARTIAQEIKALNSDVINVDLETVQTNMVFIDVNKEIISARNFAQRLQTVCDQSNKDDSVVLVGLALTESKLRLVFHYDITDTLLEAAIRKIKYVVKELENKV